MNQRLKEARAAAGLTAAKLADLAGTKEMRVFHFERGRYSPKMAEAVALCKVLNEQPQNLFPELFQQERARHA